MKSMKTQQTEKGNEKNHSRPEGRNGISKENTN